ncbi:hypothetical protein Rhow_007125 [Rhodococcus wratislaviensis]|uniref:Uncharacterized protein n=1 Tax=Rhodococcus wratislaviensis TaxID=44752 RepID=A0A402CH97_RHOWR|nr:hypothetical protein Rhow_007125 [Rhodococcus wratislaviensis]
MFHTLEMRRRRRPVHSSETTSRSRSTHSPANAEIDPANVYVDKKSEATTERAGLQTLLG